MGIVGLDNLQPEDNSDEGQHIPTKEEQEAALNKQKSQLQEEQELHKKMRSSSTAEYARDKKEE